MSWLDPAGSLLRRMLQPEGMLDILLVWFFAYEVLLLLKGSHARHLQGFGIGLGIVGLVWIVTRLLKLETFNWLLSQIAPFGLVVLIVVFQQEIRQSLEQLGRISLFGRSVAAPLRSAMVRLVNEVVRACVELAGHRIGALLVFQRDDGLQDINETGKRVDGELTAELLAAIFFPNAPLHDGAVVISRQRIEAAACLLPLSERRDLEPSLGTRHRAALGLSERTDAVVVVVSEETGAISLAVDGELQRGLREEELKGRLLEILQPAGSSLLAGAGSAR